MVQNKGLEEDMAETSQDNLEYLQGHGDGKDISRMEGYDPQYRVGGENNFSRDFNAQGATRSTQTGGSTMRDILDGLVPGAKEWVNPDIAGGSVKPTGIGSEKTPAHVINDAASRVNTSQVVLGAQAARVVYASQERMSMIIVNRDQNNVAYLGGNSAVTANTGFAIDPGASMTLAASCELWAVSPAGALCAVIEFIE